MISYIIRLLERDIVTFVGLMVYLTIFGTICIGVFKMIMGTV